MRGFAARSRHDKAHFLTILPKIMVFVAYVNMSDNETYRTYDACIYLTELRST